jgi:hypothetical protein
LGTLSAATLLVRTAFLNWLLKRIGLTANEKDCSIELWRRIPHPDTQGMGGPEIDFLLQGDRTIVFGEAKWRSGEGSGQGVSGTKSQLQLRREFCDGIARAIFGELRCGGQRRLAFAIRQRLPLRRSRCYAKRNVGRLSELVWTSACDRIPSLLRMEATLVEEVAIALTSRRVAKMCL